MESKRPKEKKCRQCKEKFTPSRPLQSVCGFECAVKKSKADTVKREKKKHTEAKRRLKDNDRSFQLKKTQQIFNKYVRLRDSCDPCISCNRHHAGQYHAGHYRTVGANPELRFDERNCHKQCSACNNHLSGNLVNYRINLIHRIGSEQVDELEGPHEPKRYTIEDLKEIQETYKHKIKELEDVQSSG
jgi:hypothetical protein